MKKFNVILALTLISVLGTSLYGIDPPKVKIPSPRENIKTAIPAMIRLLEAKKYEDFIDQFAPPQVIQEILKFQTKKEFLKSFAGETSDALLAALKHFRSKKPKFNKAKDVATYTIDDEKIAKKLPSNEISFFKIGKFWYINDR